MKQLCHRILQKQSGLKDPQFTPAVRVSGGEIHFFFIVIFQNCSPIFYRVAVPPERIDHKNGCVVPSLSV
jgi:hypothetical protein